MSHEILNAIEQGLPFAFDNHTLLSVPFDDTIDEPCEWCEIRGCAGIVMDFCLEVQDAFAEAFYFKVLE